MNQSEQSQLEHSLNLLGAESDHGWDDIEKQYRQLAQKWHPDRNTGRERDTAKSKFIEINAAYKYIRTHYRKTGSIQRPIPIERPGPLLGIKMQTLNKPTWYKNKLVIASSTTTIIVVLLGALLWSLDSRLAENNRGRASTETTVPSTTLNLPPSEPTQPHGEVSKQSSADAEL